MNCLGSEELGDRIDEDSLRCRRCYQTVSAYSPTYDLVPMHEEWDDREEPSYEDDEEPEYTIKGRIPRVDPYMRVNNRAAFLLRDLSARPRVPSRRGDQARGRRA